MRKAKAEIDSSPDLSDGYYNAGNAVTLAQRYKGILALLHSSEPAVQTVGKIPEAEICFLDEIFKCNDGVLNSLLTALNEHKYTNEGRTYPIPTISFFAASNEIPNFNDPQEKILEALYDRLELKVITDNIQEKANRMAVLKSKQAGTFGQTSAAITMDELLAMQKEVAAVPVPDAANELADDILCELRKNGVPVSDRKYLNYYPITQAKAWLSGHAAVEATDLLALKNYLWKLPATCERGSRPKPPVHQPHAEQGQRHSGHGDGGPGGLQCSKGWTKHPQRRQQGPDQTAGRAGAALWDAAGSGRRGAVRQRKSAD